MGFEPTTFRMAIRQVSETSGPVNAATCRGFAVVRQMAGNQEYARICTDMRRFGNFDSEVPETAKVGSICLKG